MPDPRFNIISHKHKYIFTFVPKSGCVSLRRVIADIEGLPWEFNIAPRTKFDQVPHAEFHKYPDYYKFTFVRNPWDRLVSCYADKVVKARKEKNPAITSNGGVYNGFAMYKDVDFRTMTFEQFVEFVAKTPDSNSNGHFISQHTFLKMDDLDFVGYFESIQTDFNVVTDAVGLKRQAVPHLNRTDREDYQDLYDDRTKALVAKRFATDINLFGYKF